MQFLPLGDKNTKGGEGPSIFRIFTNGVITHRDAWTYNFSRTAVQEHIKRMIRNYNGFIDERLKTGNSVDSFIRTDKKLISWNASLLKDFEKGKKSNFDSEAIVLANYRPFQKQFLYSGRQLIWSPYRTPSIFPRGKENLIINMTGLGTNTDFSALISDLLPDVQVMSNSQGFPRYYFADNKQEGSLPTLDMNYSETRIDAISDWALELFRKEYGNKVTKDEIFYYVYGVLTSPEFILRYKTELKKDSPRVPLLKEFKEYSDYGKNLSKLQLNYENLENDFVKVEISEKSSDLKKLYRVEKMRFGQGGDKSIIHFNQFITISNIPEAVYSYLINGKTPIEWVMDRYTVKEDNDSGNLNDPNNYSQDPKYVLNLLLGVIAMTKGILELQQTLPKLVILGSQ
jgi:predicted helicase